MYCESRRPCQILVFLPAFVIFLALLLVVMLPQLGTDPLLLTNTSTIEEEFAHWERLVFSFDMDGSVQDQNPSSTSEENSRGTRSRSGSAANNSQTNTADVQDAVLLAQVAATMQHNPGESSASVTSFLQTLLSSQGGRHPQFPNNEAASNMFSSDHMPSQPNPWMTMQSQYMAPQSAQFGHFQYPTSSPVAGPSFQVPLQQDSPPADPEDPEDSVEDKRRRNTAASARFRIKKKQRTLNLERSVSDLSGRAEELEREAADLRRENGWLKEIVMLKGSRLAGAHITPDMLANASAAAGTSTRDRERPRVPESRETGEDEEGSDDTDEEYIESSKGKGKSKGKSKRK
ncbi:hypothetical protein C8J56DRAFT_917925 [Mycena floridula]|nr:hypothetical protein C8J56DRAFT_917925 [Mycena floridula]